MQDYSDSIQPDGGGYTVQTPGGAAVTHCAVLWFCLIGNTNAVCFTASYHRFPVMISNSRQKLASNCWTSAKKCVRIGIRKQHSTKKKREREMLQHFQCILSYASVVMCNYQGQQLPVKAHILIYLEPNI